MSENPIHREAFTPREWAEAHRIPLRSLYRLWEKGDGPERTRISERRALITRKAGERFLAARTEA